MEWEYKILEVELKREIFKSLTLNYEKLEIQLNVLGKSSWELVGTTSVISPGPETSGVYFIFKREVKEC